MASRASFRRKPEPRVVSYYATFALAWKGALAQMPSGGLRRNDQVEHAGRFSHYFILQRKDQDERERTLACKTRFPRGGTYTTGRIRSGYDRLVTAEQKETSLE